MVGKVGKSITIGYICKHVVTFETVYKMRG